MKKRVSSKYSYFLTIFMVLAFVGGYLAYSCRSHIKEQEHILSDGDTMMMNLSAIEECIQQFIVQHREKGAIQQFALTVATLKGRREQQEEGVWFLGEWIIEGEPETPIAHYSRQYSETEGSRLILSLHKQGEEYQILSWEIEEYF